MPNLRRTLGGVRFAGAALLCVVAAFGAAFFIRRAVDRGSPSPRGTVAADTRTAGGPSQTSTGRTSEAVAVHHRVRTPQLAAEFAPGVQRITRKRPRPKHHRRAHHEVSHSSAASSPTDVTSTPTYTTSTPSYTAPSEPSPTTASSGGAGSSATTHHSSGSGTGTTSIGGSTKGSGTTTIG